MPLQTSPLQRYPAEPSRPQRSAQRDLIMGKTLPVIRRPLQASSVLASYDGHLSIISYRSACIYPIEKLHLTQAAYKAPQNPPQPANQSQLLSSRCQQSTGRASAWHWQSDQPARSSCYPAQTPGSPAEALGSRTAVSLIGTSNGPQNHLRGLWRR